MNLEITWSEINPMLPEQNLPWWRADRPWGFRFSAMDAAILLVGAAATAGLWETVGPFTLLVPYLLGHFFLFCNTFRVGGERSLIWVGTFLGNFHFWTQTRNLPIHLGIQAIVTMALIGQCVFGANYHGFACERWNSQGFRKGALSEGAFTRKVLRACRVPRRVIEALVGRRMEEFETKP